MVVQLNYQEIKLTTWSYSRLSVFEQCPKRYYYSSIEKIPTPQHPAATRGTNIHIEAENYIKGEGELTKGLQMFELGFEDLKQGYIDGHVFVEEDWAFDLDWQPSGWREDKTWCRYKIDAYVKKPDRTVVIDFKTGRYMGNEESHEQQCALYASATYNRDPSVENIQAELWYLDHGKISRHSYTVEEIKERQGMFHERALKLTEAKEYPANASVKNCRWCHYGKIGICDEYRSI
jgi:CRISPR/Cas system-associated exonuclease Cas4 (RecB family)